MLNFLKRIYLVLVTFLLVLGIAAFLLAPGQVGGWLTSSVVEMSFVVRVIVTVLLSGLLLALTYIQVRPAPSNHTGLVMKVSGAITDVSIESARDRILKAVEEVVDVVSAEADIKPVRGKADLELRVVVMGHGIKLPDKQKEINRALKQVINKQLGLQMAGRPRVHIQLYTDTPRSPAPVVTTPATPEKPAAPPVVSAPEPKPVTPPPPVETKAPEPEPKNGGGLFGWRRDRHVEDKPAPVETPAAPVSVSPPVQPMPVTPPTPAKPVESVDADTDDDDNDEGVGATTLILDSDEKVSARQELSAILGMDLDDDSDDAADDDDDDTNEL
ncbi:MAG: hypothetical protein K8I60_07020 [Anaerolineae bacterium]|nr:hypothetical protein [Anaerolineae bacterium]